MKTARKPQAALAQDLHAQLGLRQGQSIELLKALHIVTREGRINQDSRRKLKQVEHLYRFIESTLDALSAESAQWVWVASASASSPTSASASASAERGLVVVDLGAGKSYLGFVIHDLYFRQRSTGSVHAVESRPELVAASQVLAEALRVDRMVFHAQTVQEAMREPSIPAQVDLVTALHACDTATDDAIAFGLARQARALVLVPCCQAEAAAQLRQNKALQLSRTPLAELWRHPLHTREMGSQITNVLRCLYLESEGYNVTVTELVGWEHSLKNELILARYTGQRKKSAGQRLQALLAELGLQDWGQRRFPSRSSHASDLDDSNDAGASSAHPGATQD